MANQRPEANGKREVGQLYSAARKVLDPIFAFAWNIEVVGVENIPTSGGAIIAPNHLSVIDHFVVGTALPRRITYVGKAEYMDSWKTRHLFPALGMVPIDRGGGSAAERALSAAARLLDQGELFGIYPEGTRSRDGKLHRGHTGIARLALRTGCPIIPTGLIGTDVVQPAGARAPRPFNTMRVSFGRPVEVTRYLDRPDDHMVLRQITDEVMYEIREMSGQEYVNTYAPKGRAEAIPAPTAEVRPLIDLTNTASGGGAADGPDASVAPEDERREGGQGLAQASLASSTAPRRSSADVLGSRGTG